MHNRLLHYHKTISTIQIVSTLWYLNINITLLSHIVRIHNYVIQFFVIEKSKGHVHVWKHVKVTHSGLFWLCVMTRRQEKTEETDKHATATPTDLFWLCVMTGKKEGKSRVKSQGPFSAVASASPSVLACCAASSRADLGSPSTCAAKPQSLQACQQFGTPCNQQHNKHNPNDIAALYTMQPATEQAQHHRLSDYLIKRKSWICKHFAVASYTMQLVPA